MSSGVSSSGSQPTRPQGTGLQGLITEMRAIQETQETETSRLRQRLSWLESRRQEFYNLVASDNGSVDTRRKLEETDRQIERMQSTLNRAESDLKQSLLEIRQRIIALLNEEMALLEEQLKELRRRKNEIHHELLPEATARVTRLHEEESQLDQQIEEVVKRLSALANFDVSAPNTSRS
ncbi:MAG TPA: hypothetical protein PLS90_07985 [Candidatus Sumerlaeota bacterium]|nr:MAG: hypothetical protein BWZ08_01449 [candidate division BRC1 bacterium ADurb.BinA292]HOE97919.1 hypothetical protein [Candidatus Sumerlaeota bacterium]HOR29613.1 hypothetical protein [Candidatus Sumerlaeota bacterium]HPK02384.1 hypothetical protein [Candidatus Sumerlaeota bacterium]